ncbi:MAG: methyl-accepting chemotaxis protein [Proteobacteria bacterium]|nr:methyl-accepting chemotaxis protein [Pseudomonadota bacterium]
MNASKMKLATRLGLGFGTVLLLLIAVSGMGILKLNTVKDGLDLIVDHRIPNVRAATEIIDANYQLAVLARDALLSKDPQQVKKDIELIPVQREQIKKSTALLESGLTTDEGKRLFLVLVAARDKYAPLLDEFAKLITANENEQAYQLQETQINAAHADYIAAAHTLISFLNDRAKNDGAEAASQVSTATWTIIGVSAAAILLALVIALLIIRKLASQLGGEPDYAADVVKSIAGGDLSRSVAIKPGDETSLLAAMKDMQQHLKSTIAKISESVETINNASQEIAAGNSDLSQRTEEQASSLEETASSIEQLTATVKQNADNAAQASHLAHGASQIAVKGGDSVSHVVHTMNGINEASHKIVDIISVIDGIAFQTNILALNAAVEAARAGEQGRGFAVVAGEVRSLAQRSAAAAKEIKSLINDSVGRVEEGSRQVEDAGQTMAQLVASVKQVSEIIADISNASMEQSAGIEQVNQAIAQMDQVTQQNAALVEESAAAAESLEDQARSLAQAIAVFQVDSLAIPAADRARAAAGKPVGAKRVAALNATPRTMPQSADEQEWQEF